MPHDVPLIATVAVAFVLAFAFGYAADRLRMPPLVGYLLAGVAVGPFTPGFEADMALAGQLAEMGVILLMFGVGLHFSASDLLAVKGVAIPGAVGQIVLATLLGVGLASLWGWGLGAGLVFGLSLSVASTVVLLKALEERNLLNSAEGRVAVGWLIVEDLAMVLALVLLPAFSVALGGNAPGADGHGHGAGGPIWLTLALTLGKVGAFAALAMIFGPRVVPFILAKVARTGSRELFTLSVLAIAIGIAYGSAVIFGVSFALGAFFAGVVLNESRFSHKAATESMPLQDAFSVLFFVSVGMLFDPTILVRDPLAVFAVVLLIVVGKSLIAFAIVLLLRYPVFMGLAVSASLAQIGEFSFILAGLGMSLGLLPAEGRDLILAGALLSITLNPLVFLAVDLIRKRINASRPAGALPYGAEKFEQLQGSLAEAKRLGEEREHAHELRIQALTSAFPVLSMLDAHDQERLLLLFKPKTASPGERVIRRGDRATEMYFISSGAVEVLAGGRTIRLEAGSLFGEMALLSGRRRNADISAVDYCKFLVLERRDFNQFTARYPALRSAFIDMANERRRMNEGSAEEAAESV
ncbi:cyclic nucleotide-binding domain-containing protein [Azospirillum sp. RWY-5-1]|uniref:Cyclic nucleotide-binding domain-containing protein n=1 Tax=Azospirillum oleiclasticum TaxID=2735135 RepID=A0ABX2TE61_9PROT|nr:cation:proton antiporter [Azospirillum oleiclasticum]NYZ15412.1 cyclic nucleotide-binding domain-containing protein [Azospirillum oleiclasticum]NYZ22434.1 cyclic nucleotide-binding domain-containing protein [Azospirillum oleiclasticum]